MKKKMHSYQEFQQSAAKSDPSRTESYESPKYVIQPAKGDKGFALLRGLLNKVKKIIDPGVWSTE